MLRCPRCGRTQLLVEVDTYIVFDTDIQSGNIALRWIKRVVCNHCGEELSDSSEVLKFARDLADTMVKTLSNIEFKIPRDTNVSGND